MTKIANYHRQTGNLSIMLATSSMWTKSLTSQALPVGFCHINFVLNMMSMSRMVMVCNRTSVNSKNPVFSGTYFCVVTDLSMHHVEKSVDSLKASRVKIVR